MNAIVRLQGKYHKAEQQGPVNGLPVFIVHKQPFPAVDIYAASITQPTPDLGVVAGPYFGPRNCPEGEVIFLVHVGAEMGWIRIVRNTEADAESAAMQISRELLENQEDH